METELLKLLETYQDEFTDREYQCLESMIEWGTIKTFEELAEYGVERRYG